MKNHSPTLRVVQIVDYISSCTDKGVFLSDIVNDLEIPKTTVFNIVNTLVGEGIIEETRDAFKKYRLGFQAFVISKRYVEKMTAIDSARPILEELSEITQMTSFIAKQDKSKIFYLYKYVPAGASSTPANVGNDNNINTTSLGKAYLLTLNNKELKEKINEMECVQLTEHSIVDKQELYKHIVQYRSKGYSIDEEENHPQLICFGAPVYNTRGEYEMSISISGQFKFIENKGLYGKLVKQAARRISEQLGYRIGNRL